MDVFFLCRTSPRPSGSVPSAPSTSLFAETSLGVSLPGSSSSSSSLPLGGQGKRGGSRVAPRVVGGYFLPSRSTLVWWGGADVPLGICLSRAGSLLLLLLREVGTRELALLLRTPFPAPSLLTLPNSHRTFHDVRIRGSLQSLAPAFYPPASPALRGVARGWIRGLGHVRLALVDVAVALALSPLTVPRLWGRERGGRSSSASRFSRGLSRCGRSRSSGRYRSQRGSSRSRRAWSRSSDRYRSRRDRSRRGRSRSFDRYRSGLERARSHACRGVRRGRSRSPALPNRSRYRSRSACVYLLLLPSCGPWKQDDWPDVGPRRVWRPLSLSLLWPGAAAGVLPVWRGVFCRSPVCFLQELAKFFMGLSGSYSLGATGVLAGVSASAAASGGVAYPSSPAAGAATILCCDCDACWGWRFACCSRYWSWRVW